MKKVAFAWTTLIYDFTDEKEAKRFITKLPNNQWVVKQYDNPDINAYTVEIHKAYRDYANGTTK